MVLKNDEPQRGKPPLTLVPPSPAGLGDDQPGWRGPGAVVAGVAFGAVLVLTLGPAVLMLLALLAAQFGWSP